MKMILRILFFIGLLIAVFALGIYLYLYKSTPIYEGTLQIEGLKDKVEVYFDEFAIPHIYAENEEDAYMALGYLHAQERLFQMEMLRRVADGRLAEILGKDFIDSDKFMRGIGIRAYAEESVKKVMGENEKPYQKAANAYLKGINHYVNTGSTPVEFTLLGIAKQEFTPKDIYLASGYMAYSFAQGFRTDPILNKIQEKLGENYIRDLVIDYQEGTEKIPVFKPKEKKKKDTSDKMIASKNVLQTELKGEEQIAYMADKILDANPLPVIDGSNSWVLSAKKSKSGKVLFCNDPHIQYAQPSVWFEAHLEYPEVSLYGHYLAGIPYPQIGHNLYCAWGATMLQNDDVNFYREKTNPANENQYLADGQWKNFEVREEIIHVKGEEDVNFKVRTTRNGPVINEVVENIKGEISEPISVFWTFTKLDNQQMQLGYQIGRVKNMDEMREVVSKIHAPGLNIMYGDKDGNIAWWASAKYIKNPKGVNTKMILDGSDSKEIPIGFHDFSENPSSENPPSGYVYSANNQPDTSSGMLHQGYYALSDRGKRITQYLNEDKKFSVEDMKTMYLDDIAVSHPDLAKIILENVKAETENEKKSIEILEKWKGEHSLESVAPVIYNKIHYYIIKNVFLDELGEKDFALFLKLAVMKHSFPKLMNSQKSVWWDDVSTKDQKETLEHVIQQSFQTAIKDLETKMGAEPAQWKWEKVHLLTHNHVLGSRGGWLGWLFNVGPFSMIGGNEVLNISSFTLNEEGTYKVLHGASMRILIDFENIENAQNIIPTGQSGNVMSRHYNDQAAMYSKGEFRKMTMNGKEIKENQLRKLVLNP